MTPYDFTRHAERSFLKLPKDIQQQILRKLEHFLSQPNPLVFAKRIVGTKTLTFRFQIGVYRVVFDWEGSHILILDVGHRQGIYRRW